VLALFLIGVGIPLRSHMRTLRAKKEADERIHYLAQHDPLTDLPNRHSLVGALAETMKEDNANGRLTAVHFIDIDLFKQLNDTLGHDVGDAALVVAADRLTELKGDDDFAARLGGDEFALIQPNLGNPEEADQMAASIVAAFAEPTSLQGHLVKSTASVGTALAPTDGDTMSRFMKSADIALYQAKASGRNTARRFETWMDDKLAERRNVEVLLQDAISGNRLEVYYQPLFDRTGLILQGFEALARLRDHSGSFVPPSLFIPVAEKMGLIAEIGEWVIATACAFAAQWPDEIRLAINLSAEQFRGHDLVAIVEAALSRAGIPGSRLEFEITESMLMADTEDVLKTLTELKALGASVVMDDFGTGYSSLGYLWKFPFDKVKIDRSFVERFESNPDKIDKIVGTIVTLSHSMDMSVTAEGVETESQADWLRSLNCDQLQGYLFGHPTPATEASSYILKSVKSGPDGAEDPHNYPKRSAGTL
jgi:diguanylate cyclase (GGDEF)-like protein